MGFDSSFVTTVENMNFNLNQMFENPALAVSSILMLMPAIIQQFSRMEKKKYFRKFPDPPKYNDVYDYVIVGGGVAGSVLANRLSAEPNSYKVLLLEAGGPPLPTSIVPACGLFGIGVNETDWMFESVRQEMAFKGTQNQTMTLYQGKGLGGTSLESFLIHSRGSPKIFDDWARLLEDDSWSSANLRRYFKRSENYKGKYPNDELHGCSGDFPVESPVYSAPAYVLKAAKENKFTVKDLTEAATHEYGSVESPIHGSVRYNAYSAFIEPILTRQNLQVLPYSEVIKILFSPDSTKALGVEYIFEGNLNSPRQVFANNEVIISAGALNTPKLLQLSGVGPKELLWSHNIPLVMDLPVGKNLQDIVGTPTFGTYSKVMTSLIPERDFDLGIVGDEDAQNSGPLAGNLIAGMGFYSSQQNEDSNVPDIMHIQMYMGISRALPPVAANFLNVPSSMLDRVLGSKLGKDGHFDFIYILADSRGSVKIAGPDFRLPPIIDPGYFSNPADKDRLVDGIKQVFDFYENSKTFNDLGNNWFEEGGTCKDLDLNSDEYFNCYIEKFTLSGWAFTGTCKMGVEGDLNAVTDSRMRVHRIHDLRIVDASVIPIQPNTQLIPTLMAIAEKAADMIIEDAGGELLSYPKDCKNLPPPKVTIPILMDKMIADIGEAIVGLGK